MTTRARIHGVAAFLAVALVAAACQGAGGTTDDHATAATPSTSRPTVAAPGATHRHGSDPAGDMGGMDMGGMDMGGMNMGGSGAGGAHAGHDASLPPLASRLAAATPAQRAATTDLLDATRTALAPYASEAAARAAGFVPNDLTKRVIHYRNVANRRDDHELDPAHPEGLVYLRDPSGGLRLLGALYTVLPGEPAPAPGGNVFFWHTHDPSCGSFLVPAGGCTDTFRMLHVWTAPAAVDPWIQPVREAFGRA
jgi:hypothetical protein